MKAFPITAAAAAFALNTVFPLHAQNSAREKVEINFTKTEGYRDGPAANHRDWKAFSRNGEDAETFTIAKSAADGILIVDPKGSGLQLLTLNGDGKGLRADEIHAEIRFVLQFQKDTPSVRSYKTSILPLFQFQNSKDKDKKISFGLQHIPPLPKTTENGNAFNLFVKNTYGNEETAAFSERIDGKDLGLAINPRGDWTDGDSVALILRYAIRFDPASSSWKETVTLLNAAGSKPVAETSQTANGTDADAFAKQNHLFRLSPQNMDEEEVAVHIDSIQLFTGKPLP